MKSDAIKKEEISRLNKVMADERESLSHRIKETEMIWRRKMQITNDDLLRYKKVKKNLEGELKHKNEMNQKMLIQLIDHTKKVNDEMKVTNMNTNETQKLK